MRETALILEGGGMRGVYTCGVLDCFLDEGIYFDVGYGVSAGVCHVCSYVSRQRGRALRTAIDYLDDPHYAGWRSLITTGNYFGTAMIYGDIPYRLIPFDFDAFSANSTRIYAVLTNCRTGQAEYKLIRDLRRDMRLIQASSSLPLLSRMVTIDGEVYLDGGIADSLPLARAMSDGCAGGVVILTQHRGYRKAPNRLLPLIQWRYRRYPSLVQAAATRHLRYNAALELIEREEKRGTVLVIQPRTPVAIGRLEKNAARLRRLYQDGYDDTKKILLAIKSFIN